MKIYLFYFRFIRFFTFYFDHICMGKACNQASSLLTVWRWLCQPRKRQQKEKKQNMKEKQNWNANWKLELDHMHTNSNFSIRYWRRPIGFVIHFNVEKTQVQQLQSQKLMKPRSSYVIFSFNFSEDGWKFVFKCVSLVFFQPFRYSLLVGQVWKR